MRRIVVYGVTGSGKSTLAARVGLDFPRWRSLGRLLRRTIRRIVLRTEICNGNRERVRNLVTLLTDRGERHRRPAPQRFTARVRGRSGPVGL